MQIRWTYLAGAAVAISLLLLILPKFLPVCTGLVETAKGGQIPMRCHYTYQSEYLFALASLILSAALFTVRGGEGRRILGGVLALLGLFILILPQPWVSGVCANTAMACNKTLLGSSILAVAQILLGLFLLWKAPDFDQPVGQSDSLGA